MGGLILKSPNELTNGDLKEFEKLVIEGAEVAPVGLRNRILAARKLAFIKDADRIIAVGGLKTPDAGYVEAVAKKSAFHKLKDFRLELGWVFVVPDHRRKGHSRTICRGLMGGCIDKLFASTRTGNSAMRRVLDELDFKQVGKTWKSTQHPGEDLSLWVREALQPKS